MSEPWNSEKNKESQTKVDGHMKAIVLVALAWSCGMVIVADSLRSIKNKSLRVKRRITRYNKTKEKNSG